MSFFEQLFVLRGFQADNIPWQLKGEDGFEVTLGVYQQGTARRMVHVRIVSQSYDLGGLSLEESIATFITPAGRVFSFIYDGEISFPRSSRLVYHRQLSQAELMAQSLLEIQPKPISLTQLLDQEPELEFEES